RAHALRPSTQNRAARASEPFRQFGPPIIDRVERMPYPRVNTLLDEGTPAGALNYWKSAFFIELSDAPIETIVAAYAQTPTSMCIFVIEHCHGEATRVDPTATAFPHRSA